MEQYRKIISVGLLTMAMSFGYGCELKPKPQNKAILAHAIVTETNLKNNTVKIALLLDTSNSMDGLINQAKSQLWNIVNEFTHAKCGSDNRPELQIAIYQYGNDGLSSREGYIQQVLNFRSDLD